MTNSPALNPTPIDNYDFDSQCLTHSLSISETAITEYAVDYDKFNLSITEITEHSRYLQAKPQLGAITLLISGMGTGKTTAVSHPFSAIIEQAEREHRNPRILILSHRKALNKQLSQNHEVKYYEDIKRTEGLELAYADDLATSPESLIHIPASNRYDAIFIDEVSQVLDHTLLSKTMKGSSRGVYNKIRALVNRAGTVILADAHDSKQLQQFLKSVDRSGNTKPIVKVTNTFKPHAEAGDTVYIHKSRHGLVGAAREHRAANPFKKLAGISNEIEKSKTLIEAMQTTVKEPFLVTGSQNNDLSTESLISNIIGADTFVTSPALTSGFSVAVGHGYDTAFCDFGARSITAEESCQMMHRLREIPHFEMFLGSASVNRYLPVTTTGVINRLIREQESFEFRIVNANADYDCNGELIIDDFSVACAAAIAERNRSLNNFKGHMIHLLEDQGFNIVYVDECSDDTKAIGKEIVAIVKDQLKEEHQEELVETAQVFESILHVDSDTAMELAIRDDKYHFTTKGVSNACIAHMTKDAARKADMRDKANSSAIDLKRYSASKRVLDKICAQAGLDMETFTLDGELTWSKENESDIKRLMHKNHWTRFEQLGIPINSKSKPVSWFNKTLKYLGLDVTVIRDRKHDYYKIDPQSIDILRKLMAK